MDLKPNSGVIFKNEKKTADNHPEYRGEIDCEGVRKEISLWVNKDKNGKSYFSAKLSDPYRPAAKSEPAQPPESEETGDDLPF